MRTNHQMKKQNAPKIFPCFGYNLLRLLQLLWQKMERLFGLWRVVIWFAERLPSWQRLAIIGPNSKPFYLDLRDPSCIGILVRGFQEQGEKKLVRSFLPKDAVILDIGANVGFWSRYIARICPDGCIFAFEPSQKTFNLLLANCLHFKNIHPLHIALSDIAGKAFLSEDLSSDVRHLMQGNEGKGELIDVLTLDIWAQVNICRLDFIKLDVEGAELRVLKGAAKIIQHYKPAILFEYIPENEIRFGVENLREIVQFLRELGYDVKRVMPDGTLIVTLKTVNGKATNNYFAMASKCNIKLNI